MGTQYSSLHKIEHWNYQRLKWSSHTDEEIVKGYFDPYVYKCYTDHTSVVNDWKKTDECLVMMNDHINMRWFFEHMKRHRPMVCELIERRNKLKAFW